MIDITFFVLISLFGLDVSIEIDKQMTSPKKQSILII